jgi:hypothetical protein
MNHDQVSYTRIFLQDMFGNNEIPSDVLNQYRKLWWSNPYNVLSLKLSKLGYAHLTKTLNLTQYEIDIESLLPEYTTGSMSGKDILTYTKGLIGPWYLRKNILILFNSKDATMMGLYGPINFRKTLEKRNK